MDFLYFQPLSAPQRYRIKAGRYRTAAIFFTVRARKCSYGTITLFSKQLEKLYIKP